MGYRGKAPVLTPRDTEGVRYMGLNRAGAGACVGLYDSWPAGLYQQTRGSARWALPLFSLFLTMHTGEGDAPPCTPPLTRWGRLETAAPPIAAGHPRASRRPDGHRKARRRTIPRRRSAAPSGQGERPFAKCGIAAKPAAALPASSSKPPAAAPSGRCSRDRSAAAGKDSGSYAQCCRPSQRPRRGYPFDVPTAPPLALAAPAPHPRTTAAAAAGRAFPLGRLLRPGHRAGRARTRSAARRCPRSMTPGTAAAPAPGCWLRCLRSMRSGTAAESPLLPVAAKDDGGRAGKRQEKGYCAPLRIAGCARQCGGAHNVCYTPCQVRGIPRTYNTRYVQ